VSIKVIDIFQDPSQFSHRTRAAIFSMAREGTLALLGGPEQICHAPPMILRILSDLHFEFHRDRGAEFVRTLVADPQEVLVLAGDIAVGEGLGPALAAFCAKWRHVVFVAGNHEFYHHRPQEVLAILQHCQKLHRNFHWLNNGQVTVEGQRFVGGTLWFGQTAGQQPTRHYLSDFHAIEDLEPWVYREHDQAVAFLYKELRDTDVVVTHHLPAQECVAPKWANSPLNPFFVHDLSGLIRARAPKLWIHGHTHEAVDLRIGETRILANPFGYRGQEEQPHFKPGLTVEI
jgi:Icc-related predicted phosphoesterase